MALPVYTTHSHAQSTQCHASSLGARNDTATDTAVMGQRTRCACVLRVRVRVTIVMTLLASKRFHTQPRSLTDTATPPFAASLLHKAATAVTWECETAAMISRYFCTTDGRGGSPARASRCMAVSVAPEWESKVSWEVTCAPAVAWMAACTLHVQPNATPVIWGYCSQIGNTMI